MFNIAIQNLLQERMRLLISVGGVAFSVLLMILLQGLNVGFSNVLGQYFESVPADLWVAKANTGNIMDPSFLPRAVGGQLRSIEGVASARPYGMLSATTTVNGKSQQFYLISYDPSEGVGQPNQVSDGKAAPDEGEIIIDRIVARTNGVKPGDTIVFGERKLTVVGFSEGTFLLSSSFAFINQKDADAVYGAAGAIYGDDGTTNYWLVQVERGADTEAVRATIAQEVPGVLVHTKDHFIEENVAVVRSIVRPVFGALVILGGLIGITVIGLTIFTSTIEKAREYGVLKAIGLRNRQLYTIVLQQALTAAAFGFAVGTAIAYAINPLIGRVVPQFVTDIRLLDIAWIFLATIVIALFASYMPVRRVGKIDPAEVFRA